MPNKQKNTIHWYSSTPFGFLLSVILRDSLVWLSLGIVGLFTLETLLPGFVTARFNIAIPLFVHIALFFALAQTIRRYRLTLSVSPRLNAIILFCGIVWLSGILFISLIKLSLIARLITILLSYSILFLFWKEYLKKK